MVGNVKSAGSKVMRVFFNAEGDDGAPDPSGACGCGTSGGGGAASTARGATGASVGSVSMERMDSESS